MFAWLSDVWNGITWEEILLGVVCGVISFVLGTALATWFIVKLPATYFVDGHPPAFKWEEGRPALRYALLVGKNLLGVLIIVVGVLLSLPGVPGPGFLTIFIGIMFLNFPGKRR